MSPTFKAGQHVLAWRKAFTRNFSVGDVVVLTHPQEPEREIIKRIKAISEDKMYFVEGDNAQKSQDSRSFGFVPQDIILGKVFN